jgi:hypothetical protein
MQKYITAAQNKALHALLNQLEIADQKPAIVSSASNGRTSSSAELTFAETQSLLKSLGNQKQQELGKMQGKIIGLMKLLGYIYPKTGKENMEAINLFIANIGAKNPRRATLWVLRKSELKAVLNQIETRYKNTLVRATPSNSPNTATKTI